MKKTDCTHILSQNLHSKIIVSTSTTSQIRFFGLKKQPDVIFGRDNGLVLPGLNQTSLMRHLKELCAEFGFENPKKYKLHSFRHYFASMCANHGVAHRKALAWLGHSNSDMLDLYYHIHDDDSMQTMIELAKSSSSEPIIQYPKLKAV